MTIFGFNTDIRSGDTVYHVQTEARETELLLQSAVFVRGRCIGKHAVSYADEVGNADFCEEHVHELLTRQHRFVVSAIREGKIELALGPTGYGRAATARVPLEAEIAVGAPAMPDTKAESATGPSSPGDLPESFVAPAQAQQPPELRIEWLQAASTFSGEAVHLRLRVQRCGVPVEGVQLIARLDADGCAPIYARSVTGKDGEGEMAFALAVVSQPASQGLTVLVQARHEGSSASRKFRLRRA